VVIVMTSVQANTLFVLLVAIERIIELVVSKRHERSLKAQGGVELGRGHYPPMVVLHTFLLVGSIVEPIVFGRPFVPLFGMVMVAVVLGTQALRWWSIASLGERWCTRVIVVPSARRIARGPYRLVDHPNYIAVILEGVALPFVHGSIITAVVFTILNVILLSVRIRTEDAALDAAESV
jgi:methyltransferase